MTDLAKDDKVQRLKDLLAKVEVIKDSMQPMRIVSEANSIKESQELKSS